MTVGLVVDPLEGGSSSNPSAVSRAGMDFAIGGLYFKQVGDDDNPYQRATAQFKKDQLDNSGTYGDQSLVGWWTRGQFSFHRGQGIKYYEVSDPQISTEYRFADSAGIDPTAVGVASAYNAWSATTVTGTSLSAYVEDSTGAWVAIDGTTAKRSSGTAITGTASLVAAGPTEHYVVTGGNTINKVAAGGSTQTAMYTTTNPIVFILYAKFRLFVIDNTGQFFQLSTAPSGSLPIAVGSSNLICTVPSAPTSGWCGVDTPGAVMFGAGNTVYAFAPDSSGQVPTLSAPTVAAVLPPGESVKALATNLGFMAVCTSAGVRVAEISGTQMQYGPVLAKGTCGPSAMAWRSGAAFILGGDLWFLDFTQALRISSFGNPIGIEYATHRVVSNGSFVGVGVATSPKPLAVDAVWADSGAVGSAFLTTGLHRFDTLELKKFQTLRVRGSGAGSIQVSKVSPSGTTTSLFTMDLSKQSDVTLGIAEPNPVEALAFRFDLTPASGSTTPPTLLGYQIKALPCPERQRLIQVPLMCFDHEVRPSAPRTGHRGAAWGKLSALENMEKSGGTFQFTDFRTGEAGECYIETVEFTGKTPPGPKSSGFGGTLVLTIRKL